MDYDLIDFWESFMYGCRDNENVAREREGGGDPIREISEILILLC